jgi:hypothetical protein
MADAMLDARQEGDSYRRIEVITGQRSSASVLRLYVQKTWGENPTAITLRASNAAG